MAFRTAILVQDVSNHGVCSSGGLSKWLVGFMLMATYLIYGMSTSLLVFRFGINTPSLRGNNYRKYLKPPIMKLEVALRYAFPPGWGS